MSDEMAVATDQAMADSGLDVGTEQPQQESFFELDFEDGEKVAFKSKDELAKWAKESALRQKDYTKKTQSVAEQRRQFEAQQSEHKTRVEKELEAVKQLKEKYDRYEAAFKKRPQILQQLDRMVSQPASPDEIFQRSQGYADEKYKTLESELESLKAERQREQLERQRDDVYSRLGQRYPDFDKEQVNEVLSQLEENNLEPLLELAYKASRFNPEGAEAKVLEKLQRKQGAKISAGGGVPPAKSSGSADPDQAYMEAMQDAGLA